MVLQITSMADIFTILLVFLLKTVSTGVTTVNPSIAVLPEADAQDKVVETMKVEISAGSIQLGDKAVTLLKDFKFDQKDLESDGTPRSLNFALDQERTNRAKALALKAASAPPTATPPVDPTKPADPNAPQANVDPADDPANATKLLVMADQKTPYSTIKTVMDSAANNGFYDFKLVVVSRQ
jgi:biopolymer transport protein ExbD